MVGGNGRYSRPYGFCMEVITMNMKKYSVVIALLVMALAEGCKKEDAINDAPVAIKEPAGGFVATRLKGLLLSADAGTITAPVYEWAVDGKVVTDTRDFYFVSAQEGAHEVKLTVEAGGQRFTRTVTVQVNKEAVTYSPRVSKVFDYFPAPGQFVNTMPEFNAGETEAQVIARAESALKGATMIHLGGFGGYVVAGFDHTIMNIADSASFKVVGNAFDNWAEPGVIMVSYDANKNGLPDDEWYEIAGSEHNSAKTVKNYQITYYKPDENKLPVTDENNFYMSDLEYIRWKDNQGGSGYLSKNMFHTQSYYPQWKGDSITFKGTKLTGDNVVDQSGVGTYYVSPAFDYGYADNWANTDARINIKLDWAVDKDGKKVKLTGVDFIKVYTGIRAEAGWLGEVSTEVTSIEDVNIK